MLCLDYDDQSSRTGVIRVHYVFLLETLDVKFSGLVGHLFQAKVVSADEADDITAEQSSFRANEKLLSVLSRKSPQQFQLFLDALDNCGQQHVRDVISDRPGLWMLTINQHNLIYVEYNKRGLYTESVLSVPHTVYPSVVRCLLIIIIIIIIVVVIISSKLASLYFWSVALVTSERHARRS